MKILHIFHNSDLVNGVDQTTLTLARALQRQGVEVSALVPRVGDVTQALDAAGIKYRVSDLPCCTGHAKMAELRFLARAASRAHEIADWIRADHFDLVHLNTGHLIDGALAAAMTGAAAIWHIHAPYEIDLARYAGFMESEAYAWLLSGLGSHVIAVSDDVRNSLLPHIPADKVSTLFNGVDLEDLRQHARQFPPSIRRELGLAPETPLVLGVGRISAQKDFATFVRVARRVAQTHPSACFAIAGPEEDEQLSKALSEQIVESGLHRRVFVLGPRHDVPGLLAESEVFLSTAIFEGQGLAALEAMSLNLPVVAMDCVGLRECIRHEEDGLLVPLGDEDACAAAVLRVLADKVLAARLGICGHESVQANYSAAAYGSGFMQIAQRAIQDNQASKNTAAASFALGLLNEIREAHEWLLKTERAPKNMRNRIRASLPNFFNKTR